LDNHPDHSMPEYRQSEGLDLLPVPWVSHGICPARHRSLEESISA
jgi:hypothetical protein